MKKTEIDDLEIGLLLEAIYQRYGYDFKHYSRASLKRRINNFLSKTEFARPTEIIPALLDDKSLMQALIYNISVTVTEMFRDPFVYKAIRQEIVGALKTYPFIKIWHAGCATGQEVYSMAILLKEEGLYGRCLIYATDINDQALEEAKKGIYPVQKVKEYTANYQKSGGKESFSDYYHAKYDSVILNQDLKKNIVFANHNLVSDMVFGEIHFVMCRNALIYFNSKLQTRVLKLFYDSLAYNGFLCLGTKESLRFYDMGSHFKEILRREKIFQKKG
jgi:chemotaxis protein methyltransferase CheR